MNRIEIFYGHDRSEVYYLQEDLVLTVRKAFARGNKIEVVSRQGDLNLINMEFVQSIKVEYLSLVDPDPKPTDIIIALTLEDV